MGIDIGSESTKVTLGPSLSCEIVRTASGGHTTPTAVSFAGGERHMGETASRKGKNAVLHLNRLLMGGLLKSSGNDEEDPFEPFYMFEHSSSSEEETGTTTITVDYQNSNGGAESTTTKFTPAALTAMLLSKIHQNVQATIQRVASTDDNNDEWTPEYFLSIPTSSNDENDKEESTLSAGWLDAAYAAGLVKAQVVNTADCYAAAYQRKFPELCRDGRIVLVVDMGHASTTVSLLQMGNATSNEDEEAKEEKEEEPSKQEEQPAYTVLRTKTHASLGAGSVDIRLWKHFQSQHATALKDVTPNSRSGQRLLEGAQKLKHLLSQLTEGSLTVENVGSNDSDLQLTATRALLVDICQPEQAALVELVQSVVKDSHVTSIEVLGGGCRIPWVKEVILQATNQDNGSSQLSLSYSLDDTSAALGAALLGENEAATLEPIPSTERRQQLLKDEQRMAALDADLHAKADLKNQLEAHILELRSAKHGKFGSLLPPADTMDPYLDGLEDFLFSEECDNASKDEMQTKVDETLAKTKELCAGYFEAVQKETEAKEKEMEEEAKKAQLERNSGEENGEEDDHDNRRLPKKRRMEIVMKNKAEANELFSDGNYKFAAARYTKALTHCAKFVDLSPEDIQEVNGIKLSLNLNLALAYVKLGNQDQALRVCNEALAIDENSAKALYRRASIFYEKRKFDDAKKDIKKAIAIVPEDKAIKKLASNIDIMIKRQKDKEKKMAQKMFG